MNNTDKVLTKIEPFQVNPDDPFDGDALGRKELCEELKDFMENSTTPYTLAINAGWGNGKTVFLQMLKAYLEKQGFFCVFFDAWKADFYDNALPALIGEIKEQVETSNHFTRKAKELGKAFRSWETAAKIVATLSKTLPIGGEIIDALSQTAKEAWKTHDFVEHYLEYQKALKKFKKTLGEFASNSANDKPLVVLVDELDRCRPDFALDVLEKIKHIFDVESVFFVFGLNKKELEKTIKTVYGIDAKHYLRRFFDKPIDLDNLANPLNQAMDKIALTDLLKRRSDRYTLNKKMQFEDYLNLFFGMFNLSLRDQEQVFASVKVTLSRVPLQEPICYILLFYFTIVKIDDPDLFQKSKIGSNPEDQSSFPFEEHFKFYRNRAGLKDYQDIYADPRRKHLEPYVWLHAIYFHHNDKYREQVIQKILNSTSKCNSTSRSKRQVAIT